MADSPPDPDRDTAVGPGSGSTPGTPRWVKVSGIIAVALVLLVVVLLLTGGGHGPGRHTTSGDVGGQTPPSDITGFAGVGGGHEPPAGGHTSR